MSCLPWGYANKVVPVFVPASGDSLIVQGNALVKGGFLTVGNDGFQGNVSGAFFQMTPDNPLSPIRNPPYYFFQATPDNLFKVARKNTPPPAITPNATILQVAATTNPGTNTNIMRINAQTTNQGALISESIVSGFSGMRYVTGLTNGPAPGDIPDFFYRGGTLLINSYPSGDGAGYIVLPSDILTNDVYTGSIIFRFIFPQATTGQVLVVYKSNNVEFLRIAPDNSTITEGIWTGSAIQLFSYPYVETDIVPPGVSSVPPRQLVGALPPEDLPLAKLSESIV